MTTAGKLAWGLVLLAAVLHYDFWNWGQIHLVFGFMPIGLMYQAGISILAAIAWSLVIKFAWPARIEEWAEGSDRVQGAKETR